MGLHAACLMFVGWWQTSLSLGIIYAPKMVADQTGSLANASRDSVDDLDAAVTFGSDMGWINIKVGAAFQSEADDHVGSVTIAASAGMDGATVGFSWYDNGDNVDSVRRIGAFG